MICQGRNGKGWLVAFFLSSIALLCSASALLAQGGKGGGGFTLGEINVQVRRADGSLAPPGIHVVLESAEGGTVEDCRTEQGGKCKLRPTSAGVYIVRLSEPGYREETVRVELINTMRGYASLDLKPLPDSSGLNNPVNTVSAAELSIPEKARQEFEKGQKSLDQHKLDEGISHLRKAISSYEAFPRAHLLLGSAHLEQQKWSEAKSDLTRAVQLDDKLADGYLELGAVYNQTREYPDAETVLRKGLELKPDAAGGHYEIAKTYWALGRWQEAAPHITIAVSKLPDLAPAHVLMGNILLRQNDPAGALKEYQTYLKLAPDGPMSSGVREMVAKIQKASNK